MKSAILTIGDELLIGQVIDTNSAWIATKLNEIGVKVLIRYSIGDNAIDIKSAIDYLKKYVDIIIVTGGLGPTSDDITRDVLCEIFESELYENDDVLSNIKNIFSKRGLILTPTNRNQALMPKDAKVLFNALGTAPGMYFCRNNKHLFALPGVPFEMKEMFVKEVIPYLVSKHNSKAFVHENVVLCGIGESFLSDLISHWEKNLPEGVKLAYLPSPGYIRLRLSYFTNNAIVGKDLLLSCFDKLKPLIAEYFVSDIDESVASAIVREMRNQKKTFCIAESCTGGYISHLVTLVSGCSDVFKGALIPYSNEIKENILGVNADTLIDNGAVSSGIVSEMAKKALQKFDTDFAISVSGIAGTNGGSNEKPVGLIWIAIASKSDVVPTKMSFSGLREVIIARSAISALFLCLKELRKENK